MHTVKLYKSIDKPVISSLVEELQCPYSTSLCLFLSLQFLVPLHHHRGFRRNARRKKSDMARVVVEGMPETAAGGGGMLNRRKSKARRRKRKELFAIQMCFAGVMLGLVVGLTSVAQKAEIHSYSKQRQLMGWI
ncbi:hypothetical protein KUCAC02_024262 [Chaenocephalus aceratus]|uniref:Uncharacterized protein n=1 Tax=Chaenocephalus aceratus TaxID=36190 RepID=A0ACB9WJ49_CHAAC|nr:hypothetical protein KUCAC02_024262 [Chaenocephalus aceratus]